MELALLDTTWWDQLTLPISKFCRISRYNEAEACDLTGEIEAEQCLSRRKHKSAQCSEASSNNRLGNLKTKDLWTANKCFKNIVDWLVLSACSNTCKTEANSPCEWSVCETTCTIKSKVSKTIMEASVAKFPSMWAAISSLGWLALQLLPVVELAASTPSRDSESPVVIAFRKNEVLCHFRLLSGIGDGGALRWLTVLPRCKKSCLLEPVLPPPPIIISSNLDPNPELLRLPTCKCFRACLRP